LSTTQRRKKVVSSNISTCDERNFGHLGYEVKMRHEDHVKEEREIEKELHVLKRQLKEEHELQR